MPERPPKAWFNRAVRSLSANPEITDPYALAGWIWHHWMTPEAKAEALRGEFDPRPIEAAMKLLPRKELIRYGLLDPQFGRGMKRGFRETFRVKGYSPFPRERPLPRETRIPTPPAPAFREGTPIELPTIRAQPAREARQRALTERYPPTLRRAGYQTRLRAIYPQKIKQPRPREEKLPRLPPIKAFAPFAKRPSRSKYGAAWSPYGRGGETDVYEKEYGEYQRARRGYDPAPDHLGDLINRTQGLEQELEDLREEMIDRDRWIDEQYGPLAEEYAHQPYTREYDPLEVIDVNREEIKREQKRLEDQGISSSITVGDVRQDGDKLYRTLKLTKGKYPGELDPQAYRVGVRGPVGSEPRGPMPATEAERESWEAMQGWTPAHVQEKQLKKVRGPTMSVSEFREKWADPQYQYRGYVEDYPAEKEQREMLRKHVRGETMSLPEFQKRWQDPNQRYKLRKLRAIYDPSTKRVIPLHRNLKVHDPEEYPRPIDIHGYADEHAGAMLRIVPDVHGLSPQNLEDSVDPRTGGQVEIIPKGFLVEQQVKYPSHQWDNDILPRLIKDPTAEIDVKHGRIVLRGKNNLARNIFLDRDNA